MLPHLPARRSNVGPLPSTLRHDHAAVSQSASPVDPLLCADPLDQGTETAAWLTHIGHVNVCHRNLPEQRPDAQGRWRHTHCADCAIALPAARLQLGRIRCIDCQRRCEHIASGRFSLTDD